MNQQTYYPNNYIDKRPGDWTQIPAIFFATTAFLVCVILLLKRWIKGLELSKKEQNIFVISLLISGVLCVYSNNVWVKIPFCLSVFFAIYVGIIMLINNVSKNIQQYSSNHTYVSTQEESQQEQALCYVGNTLNFTNQQIHEALIKRWPYYSTLNPFDQQRFVKRVKEFINVKTFYIYDKSGFLEMPILISGAAIQLTFGLEEYLLERFPVINIHPQEFIGLHPFIRVLEGNVSASCINLSWKHFLLEAAIPNDGKNVGLHEMSHALYCECFEDNGRADKLFRKTYEEFNETGERIFEMKAASPEGLYSDYAYRNLQEFWAESIEIFFERSLDMKHHYPDLYSSICVVLNQDPANKIANFKIDELTTINNVR